MKKLLLTALLAGWSAIAISQTIQRVEYFFDTDPGFGRGITIPIATFSAVTTVDLNIPLSVNLSVGFHKFFVRAKDSNGQWSLVQSQNFFKSSSEVVENNDVVAMEWFIDTDPGFGQATAISFAAGPSKTMSLLIPLENQIPLGFHKFFIRAKDASGKWSLVQSQNFYKIKELPTLQNITRVEYYLGADPGFGQGIEIPVTDGTTVNLSNLTISLSGSLPLGSSKFGIRARDSQGQWSMVENKTFVNCPGVNIQAPNGLLSCTDPIRLNALKTHPESGGTLRWFLGQTPLNNTSDSLIALESGAYRVELSTTGCPNISSPIAQVNIVGGTQIRLKTSKPEMLCNENLVVSIDSANSNLPLGIPALISWFRDDNILTINSGQTFQNTTLPGTFRLRMNFSVFPGTCLAFDSDSVTITNRNLEMSLGPQTSSNSLLLCNGSLATLQADDNFPENISYKWFKNNALIPNETEFDLNIDNAPGSYVVKGTFGACVDIPSLSLQVSYAGSSNETPVISVAEDLNTVYCGGDTLHLSATGCSGPTLWSFNQTGDQIDYVTSGNSNLFATCQGSCLGSQSNVLNVQSNGFDGNPSTINYAILPFQNDYHTLKKVDFIKTYGGTSPVGFKSLFGGGTLSFGTLGFPNLETTGGTYGETDFFIRLNASNIGGVGNYIKLGGSGFETMTGILETSPHTYLLYGSSNSPISGTVTQESFGSDDFYIVKYDYQNQVKVFDKKYGGFQYDRVQSAIQLDNGQIFLAGSSLSANTGNKSSAGFGDFDYWVVKIDASGNKLADFSYGGTGNDQLASITKINENLFLLFGTSFSGISGNKTINNINGSADYWAVWIDANGVIQKQKVYGGSANELAVKALLLESDELLFAGNSNSGIGTDKSQSNRGENDFWVLKTDSEGVKIWDKTLGGNKNEELVTAGTTVENHLVFFGNTKTISPGFERQMPGFDHGDLIEQFQQDTWLVELRTDGSLVTEYVMGSCGFDEAFPILETENGDVLTASNITRSSSCSVNYIDISGIGQRYPVFLSLIKAKYLSQAVPFCKNSEVFIRANSPNATNHLLPSVNQKSSYSNQFFWSNGSTKRYFKTTIPDSLNLTFQYKILGEECFSRYSLSNLKRYPDILSLSGLEGSIFNDLPVKQFAYERLESSRNVIDAVTYTTEGGIELQPGFIIQATSQKTFLAQPENCSNE